MKQPTQFLTNEKGEKIAVVISIEEYEKLLEELEDLEDLQAVKEYEAAQSAGEKPIPLEQALAEIRRNRK
jgi:PHD/YefM family antitoxin component YafN of YafNO toxin-antitoxin module